MCYHKVLIFILFSGPLAVSICSIYPKSSGDTAAETFTCRLVVTLSYSGGGDRDEDPVLAKNRIRSSAPQTKIDF